MVYIHPAWVPITAALTSREAEWATYLLTTATGLHDLAIQPFRVRPVIAVVGGRVLIQAWAPGVAVVMTANSCTL
jgi:hypothetical protein